MKSKAIQLNAEDRTLKGKGASRRLRRLDNKLPAIVYGGGQAPTPIMLEHNKIIKAIENEAFFSQILTLNLNGKPFKAVVKDMQRHHFKSSIMHMDFLRVKDTDVITMRIPLHFINEEGCPGVKAGGQISHHLIDVELKCQAGSLPEYIEVDMANCELDQSYHLSDIKLPPNSELVSLSHHGEGDNDMAVVSIHLPRMAQESAEEAAEGTAEEATGSKAEGSKSEGSKKENSK